MYLEANLGVNIIGHFALGVRLIRADEVTLKTMREGVAQHSPKFPGEYVFESDVQWLLALPTPKTPDHVPVVETGVSLRERVERAIVDSFVLCLRLTRQTAVICPIRFDAHWDQDSVVIDLDTSKEDYNYPDYERPSVDWCEPFADGDVAGLTDLWDEMVELRQLGRWDRLVSEESFFAMLDLKANERMVDRLCGPGASKTKKKEVAKVIRSLKEENPDWGKYQYREAFGQVFAETEEATFWVRTRLGRALKLYDEGLDLPGLHAFLSMCLVLETLFTVDQGELTHKITTRMAKIIGGSAGPASADACREDIYDRAGDVYRERGNIVHGSRLIDRVEENIRKDAFELSRLSLRRILCDAKLRKFYADPSTQDKGSGHRKDKENV